MTEQFIRGWTQIQQTVHQTAQDKGWWEDRREDGTLIALMHSELSEALEGLRHNAKSDKIYPFLAVEEELADTVIRIMDAAEERGWNVVDAIMAKLRYNLDRSYKHGGKAF